jgi:hypothetical protein
MEQMLLNNASLDDLIKMKIEKEFKHEMEKSRKKPEKKTYIEISEAPKNLIFSKYAIYRVFNRNTKCESFINGLQAEGMLGMQDAVREKIAQGLLNAFTTEDCYVKFECVQVTSF